MDNYKNPKPGRTYLSPALPSFVDPSRNVRIATKLIEHPDTYAFAQVKRESILRQKEGAKSCITAKFFEDDRGVLVLSIQKYTVETGKPHGSGFSFIGDEIGRLVDFLGDIKTMPLSGERSFRITDEQLRRLVLSTAQAQSLAVKNQDVLAEVARHSITKEDVVAVAYRKKQLQWFDRLLGDETFFERIKKEKGWTSEGLWQRFFEKNRWIFGYGLSYVYLSGWNDKKLEQLVSGPMIFKPGKRADGLLRSRGVISSLCFLEIKTHMTEVVDKRSYRSGCWAPSEELSGAVSQVQGTVAAAVADIRGKLSGKTKDGQPTGEEAYNHMPKAYLVVGNLKEFVSEHGVNEEKHRSFELFRGNTMMPEIITFDELYERARFIVEQHDATAPAE